MKVERRFINLADLNIRAAKDADSGEMRIGGYVVKFNKASEDLGYFREVREIVAPGAFKQTLAEDEIRAFWNHNYDIILGRSGNQTLQLREDSEGLAYDLLLPDTQAGRDLFVSVQRGDVTGTSFGFEVREENVEYGEGEDDPIIRTLKNIRLFEISPVVQPAYPDSVTESRDESSLRHWAQQTLDKLKADTFKPAVNTRMAVLDAEVQAQLARVK